MGVNALIALVVANQVRVGDDRGPELVANLGEQGRQDQDGVVVQETNTLDLCTVILRKRNVVHIFADDVDAEVGVVLTEQHVSMPERIEDFRQGVAVGGVEHGDSIVLFQREDAVIEELVAQMNAELCSVRTNFLGDLGEVFRVNPLQPFQVQRGANRRRGDSHQGLFHNFQAP